MDKTEHIKTISIIISIKYTLLSIIFLGLGIITLYFTYSSNSMFIVSLGNVIGIISGFIAGILLFKIGSIDIIRYNKTIII